MEDIKVQQIEDGNLNKLKKKTSMSKEQEITLDAEGVLSFQGIIYALELIIDSNFFIEKSHGS